MEIEVSLLTKNIDNVKPKNVSLGIFSMFSKRKNLLTEKNPPTKTSNNVYANLYSAPRKNVHFLNLHGRQHSWTGCRVASLTI